MKKQTRRVFLRQAAVGGLAASTLAIAGTKASGKVLGANNTIRVAVVGIRGRGQCHIQSFDELKNVRVTHLVDVDTRTFGPRLKAMEKRGGQPPKCVNDLRKVLDAGEVDVVAIASPNHWHSLQAIWACQAGKDVYVEKPCSHNIFEGRKLVEASRKYDCIVQHGTQRRSSVAWKRMMAAIHGGQYGKLLISYGYASKPRGSIGFEAVKAPPAELDFDLWLGPATQQPYHANLVPYKWHWFWDFGNGEIGNQGVHQMDVARWAMPVGAAPQSVVSLGGRFGYKDQAQTPNTQLTIIDFGGPKIFFEDRGLVNGKQTKVANEFYMEAGVIKGGMFFPKGKTVGEPLPENPDTKPDGTGENFANFIDCVRSHKRSELNAEIIEGHLSALCCHLGNVSYRLGQAVPFTKTPEAFAGDKAASEAFEGLKEHLVGDAKMKLEGETYRLGRKLTFDAKTEKFIGDEDANKMLTRPYRKPFVVPESV